MMIVNFNSKKGFGLLDIIMGITLAALLFTGILYLRPYNVQALQRFNAFSISFLTRAMWSITWNTPKNGMNITPYHADIGIFPSNAVLLQASCQNMNGSDTLTVQYQGNEKRTVLDCMGSPLDASQTTINQYFINSHHQLICLNVNKTKTKEIFSKSLIDNCDAMHIRYGLDLNNDGVIDRYVSGDFPGLSYDSVYDVKISLLINTQEKASPILESKFYTLQDLEFGPFKDHYLRRVFTMNIPLKKTHQSMGVRNETIREI